MPKVGNARLASSARNPEPVFPTFDTGAFRVQIRAYIRTDEGQYSRVLSQAGFWIQCPIVYLRSHSVERGKCSRVIFFPVGRANFVEIADCRQRQRTQPVEPVLMRWLRGRSRRKSCLAAPLSAVLGACRAGAAACMPLKFRSGARLTCRASGWRDSSPSAIHSIDASAEIVSRVSDARPVAQVQGEIICSVCKRGGHR